MSNFDVPAGATQAAKPTLVSDMTTSLEQAYRVPDTRIFLRERAPGETSQDGQLNTGGPRPVGFLEVPPGITVEAKRTLVQQISGAVTQAYGVRDVLILFREYALDMVSQDGGLQSENPVILEAMRQASAGRWSTAQLLQTTASSVNSALQRARATLSNRLPMGPPSGAVAVGATQRVLLDRYVRAWESDDLDGFVALLRDDAVLAMPPWREWYRGPGAIAGFIRWARSAGGAGPDRLVATGANGQPAFALYSWDDAAALHRLHGLQVLDLAGDTVLPRSPAALAVRPARRLRALISESRRRNRPRGWGERRRYRRVGT